MNARTLEADTATACAIIDRETPGWIESAVTHAWDASLADAEARGMSSAMPDYLATSATNAAEEAARDAMDAAYILGHWTLRGTGDYTEAGNPDAAADRGLVVVYGAAYVAALRNIRSNL